MKDKQFLWWMHERLRYVHNENTLIDYMGKLRSIIIALPEDQETPNTLPSPEETEAEFEADLDEGDKIRKLLREGVDFVQGGALRARLHTIAVETYKSKHSPVKYLNFMEENANGLKFQIVHPQTTNQPFYLGLFTIKSQHVYGDCVSECLDKAMDS